ncbi:MAG: aminotransferase class IV [Caldilineaceae bacterium]
MALAVSAGFVGYWNAEQQQLYVFRILDHYRRFLHSAKLLMMDLGHSALRTWPDHRRSAQPRSVDRRLLRVRPLAYKATEGIGVKLHGLADGLTIFSVPMGNYLPIEYGIHLGTSSWRRGRHRHPRPRQDQRQLCQQCADQKRGAAQRLRRCACAQPGWSRLEASAANFMMVRNGKLITRRSPTTCWRASRAAPFCNWRVSSSASPVEERPIDRSEVYAADEVLLCGTGVQISPVTAVDHRTIGDGKIGPVDTDCNASSSASSAAKRTYRASADADPCGGDRA